jgi:multidrug resistance efflux pump
VLPRRTVGQPGPRRRRAVGLLHVVLKLAIGLALAALAWVAYEYWLATQLPPRPEISGVIEADEVVIGSEVAGRIVTLTVTEGQRVAAGAELGRLDDSRLKLQMSLVDVATRRQLDLEADKYVLRAPRAGQVTRVVARVGEMTMPGQPVLVIADLAEVKANLYVPVRNLSNVRVGQMVALTADPYPGRTFSGIIMSVNPKAEYTPRNVQSQRDRLNLVFGITVRIDNRDGALLPGLPVQATIIADAPVN